MRSRPLCLWNQRLGASHQSEPDSSNAATCGRSLFRSEASGFDSTSQDASDTDKSGGATPLRGTPFARMGSLALIEPWHNSIEDRSMTRAILAFALAVIASASAADPPAQPKLPLPNATPSAVKFSKVIGWPDGKMPAAPSGFTVTLFADGF